MENDKNEPKTNKETSRNSPEVNYEKLSAVLRQDMRDASNELLKLKKWLDVIRHHLIDGHECEAISQHIDSALEFLDCTDHLQDESSKDATS